MTTYSVTQEPVSTLLTLVQSDKIAIPELQRPFVWDSVKVRDLMDSLYKGYPVGYLITWQSVGAKLKGGDVAAHQQILIDGQQRITALRAAVAGLPVVNKKYKSVPIRIAFNPITEAFETRTPALAKSPQWIGDISELFNAPSSYTFISRYFAANPDADHAAVEVNIGRLLAIRSAQIGIIALADDLDVETVSEIFIRINSKGVPLGAADFAMSKIATYGERGRNLRKLIDYFCHLAIAPHVYDDILANDAEFAATDFLSAISWLRHDTDDLYDPEYSDLIRVAGMVGFRRGKTSSIVAELSGRDPETRTFDEERIPAAYDTLERALRAAVGKYAFQNFVMTIKSAGFIDASLIGSRNALNFAYALYLLLHGNPSVSDGECKRIVRRWYVMSMLTGRHSGSFESTWEQDLRRIEQHGAAQYLAQLEESLLGDGFWRITLPANLETSSVGSPYFRIFRAAQVATGAHGFLSKSITVAAMITHSGDIHHLVPKDYLRKNGFPDRGDYNQIANFAITETPINIRIGNRAPADYMGEVEAQIASGRLSLGEIADPDTLSANLRANAIPEDFATVTAESYRDFLVRRRELMAALIRDYYLAL